MEQRLENCEQYSTVNTVEAYGVPPDSNEDIMEVVKKVSLSLDFAIMKNMIDIFHRFGKRPGMDVMSRIVVYFFDKWQTYVNAK